MRIRKGLFLIVYLSTFILQTGCGEILNASLGESVEVSTNIDIKEISCCEITEADKTTDGNNLIPIVIEEVPEGILQITEAGTYSISGNASNGKIIINVDDDQIVHLILNGIEIHSDRGPAIYVENAAKVVLTLADGTVNAITDSMNPSDDKKSCIFSNCDLTINGNGYLNVYGYNHDAIRSKDCLKIISTNIIIKAKNDGIRGNDGVVVLNSILDIQCEGIGVKSFSNKDFVIISGGECKIIAGENGIYSENNVFIKDCMIDFRTVEEMIRCSGEKCIYESES